MRVSRPWTVRESGQSRSKGRKKANEGSGAETVIDLGTRHLSPDERHVLHLDLTSTVGSVLHQLSSPFDEPMRHTAQLCMPVWLRTCVEHDDRFQICPRLLMYIAGMHSSAVAHADVTASRSHAQTWLRARLEHSIPPFETRRKQYRPADCSRQEEGPQLCTCDSMLRASRDSRDRPDKHKV